MGSIQVVASFFLSRIDNALDATLPEALQGKVAIALAKAAYDDWENSSAALNLPDWPQKAPTACNC